MQLRHFIILGLLFATSVFANGESTSPNMLLSVPSVGVTTGPQWASDINLDLSLIDLHDHSSGKGVPVTPSGLNISDDLSFLGHNATVVRSVVLTTLSGTPSSTSLYTDGTDLFYKDSNGNAIKLTSGGSPNSGTGNISGLPSTPSGGAGIAWNNAQGTFGLSNDASSYANIDAATHIVRYNGSFPTPSGNYIAIAAPATLATAFQLTLPATLPASTQLLAVSTSGQIDAVAAQAVNTYYGGPYSGSSVTPTFKAFRPPTVQRFTSSSGTYTTASGAVFLVVELIGGGGGGAGSGSAAGGTGGTGGTSTFGTALLSSLGGGGGVSGGAGGTGGAPTISAPAVAQCPSVRGNDGVGGMLMSVAANFGYPPGGSGGAGPWGGAGHGPGSAPAGAGTAGATNSGAGGGGATGPNVGSSGNSYSGGGGSAGGYIKAIISGPSATYAYAVGAAGTAGSAGTGGAVGGAGGSGYIQVTEYYQ